MGTQERLWLFPVVRTMEVVRNRHWIVFILDVVLRRCFILETQTVVHVHEIVLGWRDQTKNKKGTILRASNKSNHKW